VFKADRIVYRSTLGLRVIKKKKEGVADDGLPPQARHGDVPQGGTARLPLRADPAGTPKPGTSNLPRPRNPVTPTPKPGTSNPETRNLKPRNPEPQT